jgi:fatty-acyl-CoA synthase
MLQGLMMDRPLLISSLISYGAEMYPQMPIVSAATETGLHRTTMRETYDRIVRLTFVLRRLGIEPGDRVATLAWNSVRHFELYYAISGIGAVCHTINPRLFPDQLAYIVNHAKDKALFFDTSLLPVVEKMHPRWAPIRSYVAMTDRAHMPADHSLKDLQCYEDLLAGIDPGVANGFVWPEFDEKAASALCYTSGTTGEPKGVLFSNRSTLLHTFSMVTCQPRTFGAGEPILPVVPLFHANAWGLPYTAALMGTPLVFPGAKLDGASLFDLMDGEKVYSAWGVPTVWLGLLEEMKKRGRKPAGFSMMLVGGSAAPRPLIETFERDYDVRVVHGWGMTEMSPVGSTTRMTPRMEKLPVAERVDLAVPQGKRVYGVEMKIVGEDGQRLPHDGQAVGELHVRGGAICSGYFENPEAGATSFDKEGWFATGDVARITPAGDLFIVDRAKDLVKSGGEWISSIDVEGIAMGVPGIANCALIGVPHPKWIERPLLVVVKAAGADASKDAILSHLANSLAKWQLPDDVVFVDQLPLTATGKVSKRELRGRFADHKLPE